MKMRNVEPITHTSFSLKLVVLYITTKTIRFLFIIIFIYLYYIFIYLTLVKISQPESQTSPRVEGMSEIQAERFLWTDFQPFRYQSIKIT